MKLKPGTVNTGAQIWPWCESHHDLQTTVTSSVDIGCVDAIGTRSPTTQRSVTFGWRRIWKTVGWAWWSLNLKISFTSTHHDKMDGLWTGTVTHCQRCDKLPTDVLATSQDPTSHVQPQVSYRDFNPYATLSLLAMRLREHWATEMCVCMCVCLCVCLCGVLPLPRPLCLRACSCHRAAILPSVLLRIRCWMLCDLASS